MDIQYLLSLQDFRNGIQDAITPFMEFISMFATTYLILIPVFIYWNMNRSFGLPLGQAAVLRNPRLLLHRVFPAASEIHREKETGINCISRPLFSARSPALKKPEFSIS